MWMNGFWLKWKNNIEPFDEVHIFPLHIKFRYNLNRINTLKTMSMDSFALQIHLRSKDSCEIWILDPMRASFDQSRIPCRVPPYLWRTLNFKAWRVHCHQWWCVIDREHKFESPCGSALKKSKSKTKTFSTRDSRVIPGLVWYRQTLIVYLKESLFLSKSPAALVATCSPEICQTITYSTTSTHLNRNILNCPQY